MEDGIEQHMRTFPETRVLIFGARLGQKVVAILNRSPSVSVFSAKSRADDADAVRAEIDACGATHVMSFTHCERINTIDYLETLDENIRDYLFAPLILADVCVERDIHYTYVSGYGSDETQDAISPQCIIQKYTDSLISRRKNALIVQVRMNNEGSHGSSDVFLLSVVDLVIKRSRVRIIEV